MLYIHMLNVFKDCYFPDNIHRRATNGPPAMTYRGRAVGDSLLCFSWVIDLIERVSYM